MWKGINPSLSMYFRIYSMPYTRHKQLSVKRVGRCPLFMQNCCLSCCQSNVNKQTWRMATLCPLRSAASVIVVLSFTASPLSSQRHLRSSERNLLHIYTTSPTRTAAGLLPLLVRPSGTVSRTLSASHLNCFQAPAEDISVRAIL